MSIIVLDSTTKSLKVNLSGAVANTNPSFVVTFADTTATAFTEASSDGVLNGTSNVTVVAAPAIATRRVIKNLIIKNNDTAAVTVNLFLDNNGTSRNIARVTLAVDDTWTLSGTFSSNGSLKQTLGTNNLDLTGTTSAQALTVSGATTLSAGTANGILYLNGSKVATTGSALTFDGSQFYVNGGASGIPLTLNNNTGSNTNLAFTEGGTAKWYLRNITGNGGFSFYDVNAASETMRLTSTGLGIGTSSPGAKLDVSGSAGLAVRALAGGVGYNSSSNVRFDIGAGNSDSVNNSATYAWKVETSGDASGQNLTFSSYRRGDTTLERARITSGGALLVGDTTVGSGSDRLGIVGGNIRVIKSTAYAANPLDVTSFSGAILVNSNNGSGDLTGLVMYVNSSYTAGCGIFAKQTASTTADLLFYTGTGVAASNVERARITSGGDLLVGATAASYGMRMRVDGGIASTGSVQFNIDGAAATDFEWVLRLGSGMRFFVNNASVMATLTSSGVWTNASDARYKENIRPVTYGLAEVMQLQPRAYNIIGSEKQEIGFVAQEVEPFIPELVESSRNSVTEEERLTLSYGQMSAVLVKAIQEQQALIAALTARVAALEGTQP